jgi:Ca2+-transporting ATPase
LIALVIKKVENVNDIDSDFSLITIAAIRDCIREDTCDFIIQCQKAGIRVICLTGDHLQTAKSIAIECGIATEDSDIVLGKDISFASVDKMKEILSTVSTVAKSSPMEKHLIVKSIQEMNEVVAVTKDGPNNVAALI